MPYVVQKDPINSTTSDEFIHPSLEDKLLFTRRAFGHKERHHGVMDGIDERFNRKD